MFLVYPSCGSGQTLNHFPIQGSSWCQINLDMRQQRELTQLQPQQHWRIFSLQKALLSPHNHYQDFAESSVGNESACNAGDPGSISGSGRFSGEWIGYPPWYSLVAQSVKDSPCHVGGLGSIPGLGRPPWRRAWQPILVFLPG